MCFRVSAGNGACSGLVSQGLWRGAGGVRVLSGGSWLLCALVVLVLVQSDGGFKQD